MSVFGGYSNPCTNRNPLNLVVAYKDYTIGLFVSVLLVLVILLVLQMM